MATIVWMNDRWIQRAYFYAEFIYINYTCIDSFKNTLDNFKFCHLSVYK